MNPLSTIKRTLADGFEYVEISYVNGWMRGLEYHADDDSPDKEGYKRFLIVGCEYPEDEWSRIKDIAVTPLNNGVKLTIKIANPGRCFEMFLKQREHPLHSGYELATLASGDLAIMDYSTGAIHYQFDKDSIEWVTLPSGNDKQMSGQEPTESLPPS